MKTRLKKNKSETMTVVTICLLIVLTLILASFSLAAANNPGHDSLYVEQTGDSEITGNLNTSGNLTAKSIIYSGVDLDLRGDSYNTASSNNQIIGGTNSLSIQSLGEIYINTLQGTASMVYLGDGSGATDTVSLNITGSLYVLSGTAKVGGQSICVANGSNCPSSLGGANITANSATAGYITQFQNGSALNSSVIYQNGSNIGIGTTSPGSAMLYVNGIIQSASGLGIGVYPSSANLQINNVGANILLDAGSGDPQIWWRRTSAQEYFMGIDDSDSDSLKISASGIGTSDIVTITSGGLVGIGTTSPAQKLQVAGNINASGYNVSTVNCIIFDSGGKICSGS